MLMDIFGLFLVFNVMNILFFFKFCVYLFNFIFKI